MAERSPLSPPTPRTAADILRRSDFARLNPRRAAELLDRLSDPLFEDRGLVSEGEHTP